jgi:hypothetical protein
MTTLQLDHLYVFAVWMLGAREAAFEAVCRATEHAPGDLTRQLSQLVMDLVAAEKPSQVDRLAELDDLLRLDTTVPVDLEHPLLQGDARRLAVLLAELQRTCLMATVRGIPSARRAVFILRHVLGLPLAICANILVSTESAVRVLELRARQAIDKYLSPRCEHLDRHNPCHCAARLGGALDRSFVSWPTYAEFVDQPPRLHTSVESLYAALPRVHLPVLQIQP